MHLKFDVIVVAKGESDQIFGGFYHRCILKGDPAAWIDDDKSFVFSLTKQTQHKLIVDRTDVLTVYTDPQNHLIVFGRSSNHDLCLYSKCNENRISSSNIGASYQPPDGINYNT